MQNTKRVVLNGWIRHLHGLAWYLAPIPRRWHDCAAQSWAMLGYAERIMIERCPCGAHRQRPTWTNKWGPWRERNTRRQGRHHFLSTQ